MWHFFFFKIPLKWGIGIIRICNTFKLLRSKGLKSVKKCVIIITISRRKGLCGFRVVQREEMKKWNTRSH